MVFRILIIGGRKRFDYARLRDALDVLLVNRLPDVEIITAGGPGVPALAACYAVHPRQMPLGLGEVKRVEGLIQATEVVARSRRCAARTRVARRSARSAGGRRRRLISARSGSPCRQERDPTHRRRSPRYCSVMTTLAAFPGMTGSARVSIWDEP